MDVEKLIRRLRNDADAYRNGETLGRAFADQEDVLDNAATALSTLQAENEKLRDELEQVKRERDAIEQDFRAFAKQWWEQDSGFPCRWCKFENSGGCEWKAKQPNEEKICAGRAFEWRGPEKED